MRKMEGLYQNYGADVVVEEYEVSSFQSKQEQSNVVKDPQMS